MAIATQIETPVVAIVKDEQEQPPMYGTISGGGTTVKYSNHEKTYHVSAPPPIALSRESSLKQKEDVKNVTKLHKVEKGDSSFYTVWFGWFFLLFFHFTLFIHEDKWQHFFFLVKKEFLTIAMLLQSYCAFDYTFSQLITSIFEVFLLMMFCLSTVLCVLFFLY